MQEHYVHRIVSEIVSTAAVQPTHLFLDSLQTQHWITILL